MTIEHPCIVKNVDKACEMIGGPSAIARSLKAGPEAPLNLRFHPDDLASRPVMSMPKAANNILLQVTVPKRTGRKRKRGSAGPFVEDIKDQAPARDAQYLLQSLQDNPGSYSIEPIATIASTHVWRSMPDFVYSTEHSDFLNEIREKVLPKSYPLMKQYHLPQTYGLTNTEVIPPAQLSSHTIPTNYSYRANPQISLHTDPNTGHQTLYHGNEARKKHIISIQWYSDIPTKPPALLPPLSTQTSNYQSTVQTLQTIFSRRPIWTRRALINQLPPTINLQTVRFALAHVAFTIRSGPWRDTVCALGIDPRSSPSFRIYQSVTIQLVRKQGKADSLDADAAAADDNDEENPWDGSRSWKRSEDLASHIFTGTGTIPPDGKIWQVCDVVDPQLGPVVRLDEGVVERECERRTRGFYPAGAWAKLKVALKYKIEALQRGKVEEYVRAIDNLLTLPDVWDGVGTEMDAVAGRVKGGYLPREVDGMEVHWSALWRAAVRAMLSKEKMAEEKGEGRDGHAAGLEDAPGEIGGVGNASTPGVVDTGEVLDDDGVVYSDEDEEEREGEEGEDAEDEDINMSEIQVDE